MTTMTETPAAHFSEPWTIETPLAPVEVRIGRTFSIGHSSTQGGIRLATEVTFTVAGYNYTETLLQINGTELHRPCGHCQGGNRPEYLHRHNGVCYYCSGRGYSGRVWANANNAAAALARLAERERIAAEEDAELAAHAAERAAIQLAAEVEAAHEEALLLDAKMSARRFLGEVGERVTFTGRVVVASWVEGFYGTGQQLVIVVPEDETWTAKMYTTAAWAYEVERGDVVTLTATVKAQSKSSAYHSRPGELVTLVKSPRRNK